MKRRSRKDSELVDNRSAIATDYDEVLAGMVDVLEAARRTSARAVNAVMTAAYWEIGRRIVEFEQRGSERAEYGRQLTKRLASDLTRRFGRGFGHVNLSQMRRFYLAWPADHIFQTLSEKSPGSAAQTLAGMPIAQTPSAQFGLAQIGQTSDLSGDSNRPPISHTPSRKSSGSQISEAASRKSEADQNPPIIAALSVCGEISQTPSGEFALPSLARRFPLSWSHYVRLLKVDKPEARRFYETEALRGGWSVRQLDRQTSTLFYERTLASRNKGAMLRKGTAPRAGESLTPEEEIKDPLVLEFLGLRDEYSETDLEDALIRQLESFLLELGGDFTFVGRQKRLRVEDEWYRVNLVFFHRTLRCLVVIDLKVGRFTHADVGQMLLYLGYAAEHWTRPGENPPVGLILCAQHNHSVARYTLDRLPDKVLAAEYRMALPDEATLAAELDRTQASLERWSLRPNVVARGGKGGRQ